MTIEQIFLFFSSLKEREERAEIEKELRAQSESLNLSTSHSSSDHRHTPNDNNNGSGLATPPPISSATPPSALSLLKDPPPLGLAGLEAFRREYLTSPLSASHLMRHSNLPGLSNLSNLPVSFPNPLLPTVSAANMTSIAESSFAKHLSNSNLHHQLSGLAGGGAGGGHHGNGGGAPSGSSSGGSATPPIGGGSNAPHRSPSSEFTSQQNWSFEEQFKQVRPLNFSLLTKFFRITEEKNL